ncbi:MAG: hypothetical protein HF978_00795 [Desulfobacteraceae bacterium]|nr:hypothetical protein [Desulfobacteraceae bacterium]MBC2754068.1 hypothetical protein [Desulfobacteraceae bacterium]
MKKLILLLFLIIIVNLGIVCPSSAFQNESPLKKYMEPANISKLDWLLLNVQISSFTGKIAWDEYGLISSVSLYSAKGGRKVGMTFVANKEAYIKVEQHVIDKVFLYAINSVTEIIRHTIPEIKKENIYANLVVIHYSGIQLIFENGKLLKSD